MLSFVSKNSSVVKNNANSIKNNENNIENYQTHYWQYKPTKQKQITSTFELLIRRVDLWRIFGKSSHRLLGLIKKWIADSCSTTSKTYPVCQTTFLDNATLPYGSNENSNDHNDHTFKWWICLVLTTKSHQCDSKWHRNIIT